MSVAFVHDLRMRQHLRLIEQRLSWKKLLGFLYVMAEKSAGTIFPRRVHLPMSREINFPGPIDDL